MPMTSADVLAAISRERAKQISKGFNADCDDNFSDRQLLRQAAGIIGWPGQTDDWGVAEKWKDNERHRLVIAAALIVAEIERLDRANATKKSEVSAEFPIGYLMDNVQHWDAFCRDTGLNPWCVNEGRVDRETMLRVRVSILAKHGILR